jgi:TonB-linked SusC/RagA family outer membrane protein
MKRKFLLLMVIGLSLSQMLWAQERTVSGRVTSTEDGSSLPGVNVVIKGTTNGTVTDSDGNYKLNLPASGGALVFSFIGLQTTEVIIGERSVVDVSLSLDVTQLSEVVVTALGLERNKDEIGSASSQIGGEALSKSGEATLINGLSGKASGVNIVRSSGDPGAGSYIQIRGQSTITGNLQPLVIVDGVPISNSNLGSNTAGVVQQSRLNDLNPDDIASIEVLKGASAAAIWGTRAANGVLVVTTKKGSSTKGKVNVSFKSTYSADEVYLTHNLTKNWGGGTLMQYRFTPPGGRSWGDYIPGRTGEADAAITTPGPGYAGYFEGEDGTRFYSVPNGTAANPHGGKNSRETFDYRDQLFKTGSFLENSLSISGGNKDDNFYVSISNLDQDGIMKYNSNYKRTTMRVNANKRYNDIVKVGSNFSYSRVSSDRVQQGSNVSGLYLGGLRTSPDFNSNYYEGTYVSPTGAVFTDRQRGYRNPLGSSTNSVYDNPLWMMKNNPSTSEVDRFIGSFDLTLSPLSWLDITTRIGIDNYADRRKDLFDPLSSAAPDGSLTLQTIRETQVNADFFAQGRFKLSNDLSLLALVGGNLNHRQLDNNGGTAAVFVIRESIPEDITNSSLENSNPFNSLVLQRTAAAYSTLDFSFKEMLFVNLTGRSESASTFGRATDQTFFYPAATAAFQFSKLTGESEAFSFGKIRAGFGTVGVQPTPYNTSTYFGVGGYSESFSASLSSAAYGSGGYTESAVLGNSQLKPEKKTEIEIGTDLRFLSDRINLGLTYFTNKTTDAILNVGVASSTGFTNKTGNAAEVTNKGFEVDLGGDVINKGGFSWNISANWYQYKNKVTDLAGAQSIFLAGFTGTSSRAVEGQPLGVLWGVDFARDTQGQLALDANGFPQAAPTESVLGDPNPDWKAGIGNTFRYKGFSLYALLEHTQGGVMWAGTSGIMNHFGRSLETDVLTTVSAAEAATIRRANGTTIAATYPANTDGTYTFRGSLKNFGNGNVALDEAWYTTLGGGFGAVSSQFIREITNFRVREVTLAYTFSGEAFRKATKLQSIDFSLTGRNLFITGPDIEIIGNDPETNLTGPSNGRGLEYFNNPSTRSYLFTIKINY